MFRRKLREPWTDPKFHVKKGDDVDRALSALLRDKCLSSLVVRSGQFARASPRRPYRLYPVCLRETIKYLRDNIVAEGKAAIEAEHAGKPSNEVPRYAAFSVWRPLKTIRRDPLALCDARTIKLSDLASVKHRALSSITENGEYICEAAMALPPPLEEGERHKFYWLPQQTSDELLVVKFADSGPDFDENIARHCLHVSPRIAGTEHEPLRESLEVRVLAFW